MSQYVDPETHAENLRIFAEELVKKYKDGSFLQEAFPSSGVGGIAVAPMTPKTPQERLAFYTMITDPGDFGLLINPYYIERYRRGLMPAPVSPYWSQLIAIPWAFYKYQGDFIRLFQQSIKAIDQAGAPSSSPA